jgi:anti-anti-sigma regulatory factor
MHDNRKRAHSSPVSRGTPADNRNGGSRSSRAPLELVRSEPDPRWVISAGDAGADRRPPLAPGQLGVRCERRPDAVILWLNGALDRCTATLLDRELDAPTINPIRLVIDLTGLVFIDSIGADTLERIHRRASERGDRLCFRHGSHIAQRPRELTRTIRLRSRWLTRTAGVSDADSYFALAMACVDVDHPRPGDRPGAA